MKKILRIITRLNIGGPARHTLLLSEGLDKTQFESLLIYGSTDRDEGDMLYDASVNNINSMFIPELKRELNFLNDLIAFRKIYKIIKTEEPDIIHTHTAKAGALGRIAGIIYNFLHHKKKITIVHTFHGHVFDGYFNRFKSRLFIVIERILALFTYKIITVSETLKKNLILRSIGNQEKIEVIPLGFDLEKFQNIFPKETSAVLNVGIVGRLVPIKNHRLFLEAAARTIRDNPEMKLRFKIIGDGELRRELEEYSAKLKISSFVNFLGWQNDPVKIYSDLDVVVLTSINEGTPASLIEAMASGKSVVAIDVGGVRDLLGIETSMYSDAHENFKILERGIIVKPHDPQSFAAALALLLENSQLRDNLGIRGREFTKHAFSKDRLIRNIEYLYYNASSTK